MVPQTGLKWYHVIVLSEAQLRVQWVHQCGVFWPSIRGFITIWNPKRNQNIEDVWNCRLESHYVYMMRMALVMCLWQKIPLTWGCWLESTLNLRISTFYRAFPTLAWLLRGFLICDKILKYGSCLKMWEVSISRFVGLHPMPFSNFFGNVMTKCQFGGGHKLWYLSFGSLSSIPS